MILPVRGATTATSDVMSTLALNGVKNRIKIINFKQSNLFPKKNNNCCKYYNQYHPIKNQKNP